jgi:hypothetical protein
LPATTCEQASSGICCAIEAGEREQLAKPLGGKQLIDLLQERKNEVEALIRPVQGFVSYTLIRAADGGASVTVCQDKAGTEESMRIAREWIGKNAANIGASPPTVLGGSVILQLK